METENHDEPPQRLNPLNDFLFYKVMGEKGDEPQLIGFLDAVLAPSGRKPIASLAMEDRAFVKDALAGKSCVLDVRATLSDGTRANIEVQLHDKRDMDRRSLFYWSKLYARDLRAGQGYRELPDTVAINVVGFDFPPGGGAHARFRLLEVSNPALELTGAMEIHFVNVVKWRKLERKDLAGNPLHRWLAWLDEKSPPELAEEAKGMDAAIMAASERQAHVMLDEQARDLYEMRQMAEMDRASELSFALEKGKMEIALNALAEGASLEFVQKITGLDMETIASLSASA